jgi:hypothetical protein
MSRQPVVWFPAPLGRVVGIPKAQLASAAAGEAMPRGLASRWTVDVHPRHAVVVDAEVAEDEPLGGDVLAVGGQRASGG